MEKEKNLELERLVFFSDAVVAIAITLLALDLKIGKPANGSNLSFADIGNEWRKFAAFFLSFILIAVFWKVHHKFYYFIKKMDGTLLWYNIFWLLFIVLLPFSTSVLSEYFGQKISTFIYALNTLFITLFQNMIWDHVAVRPSYINEKADEEIILTYRLDCNTAMINAVLAIIFSFISPLVAVIILCTRPFMLRLVKVFYKRKRSKHRQ
jgi:uncharacterized membrane protein